MNWTDRALVVGVRPHGEAAVILELLTHGRGRHLGLVHGGRSRRLRPVLQPGNTVVATWRARLDEQLGSLQVEAETHRAAGLMDSPLALFGIATLCAHVRLLPERDPHPGLFEAAEEVVERLEHGGLAPAAIARFELGLLAELGFGLDLASCAATGGAGDLVYVSPRSGRAVSRAAGEPYRGRLLDLPAFLADGLDAPPTGDELAAAFRLTGFFLEARAYGPRGLALPDERSRFVALACAAGRASANLAVPGATDSVRDGSA